MLTHLSQIPQFYAFIWLQWLSLNVGLTLHNMFIEPSNVLRGRDAKVFLYTCYVGLMGSKTDNTKPRLFNFCQRFWWGHRNSVLDVHILRGWIILVLCSFDGCGRAICVSFQLIRKMSMFTSHVFISHISVLKCLVIMSVYLSTHNMSNNCNNFEDLYWFLKLFAIVYLFVSITLSYFYPLYGHRVKSTRIS